MKTSPTLLAVLLLFFVANVVSAQSPRRRRSNRAVAAKPAASQPTPQPTATPEPVETPAKPMAPVLLATVNGQDVTTADIDQQARAEVEALEGKIAEARRQVLALEINTLLLETEARKRKVNAQQLYDVAVARKVTQPSAAEITKFIEDNREKIEQSDSPTIQAQVATYLRGEREAKLSEEFINRLRASNVVGKGVEDAPDLPPTAVLATVAGQPITAGSLNERLKPIIYQLRLNTYLVEKPALDRTITNLLLLAESNTRNIPPEEIVRKEITEKVRPPTEAEVAKFYADNKSRLKGDVDENRNQIAAYLQGQNEQRLEQEFAERLRKGTDIRLLLTEPELPIQSITADRLD